MEEREEVKGRVPPRGGTRRSSATRYPSEFKLRAVKLVLDAGFSQTMVCQELSICKTTLLKWLEKYQRDGASGLEWARRTM